MTYYCWHWYTLQLWCNFVFFLVSNRKETLHWHCKICVVPYKVPGPLNLKVPRFLKPHQEAHHCWNTNIWFSPLSMQSLVINYLVYHMTDFTIIKCLPMLFFYITGEKQFYRFWYPCKKSLVYHNIIVVRPCTNCMTAIHNVSSYNKVMTPWSHNIVHQWDMPICG